MEAITPNKCPSCAAGHPGSYSARRGKVVHSVYGTDATGKEWAMKGEFLDCLNYDTECRHSIEPFGFFMYAWLPKKCRNGKRRWLTWLEHHRDGSYTLGNRAH